ncbi:hypothetical protein BI364_09270 [Acidihalobacter yilgarnensis]|uniref:DUF58 domain-containing protein n=1 Tax=Acidihalobacter yilgarnensis TaxID=2819280 RepID=A0A1D8IT02_9GAMM|nr:hypothetical protein BI364_09270 [Acidihalobacter yilgarnensis]
MSVTQTTDRRAGHFARWTRKRLRITGNAVTLERRRLFILPTGAGLGYGAMLAVMLLFALNYNNSMIFAATFLLAGISINAIWQTHRNLLGLKIELIMPSTPLADRPATLILSIGLDGKQTHPAITFRIVGTEQRVRTHDIHAGTQIRLELPVLSRGRRALPEINISTIYPLGLFRTWSLLRFPQPLLVAPAPAPRGLYQPPGHSGSAQADAVATQADEEDILVGLRPYQYGDPIRRIAWRASARSEALLSKQFQSGTQAHTTWLRWTDLPALDTEKRLSVLCRWVLDADGAGHPYGLVIPGAEIPPNRGPGHRRQCLEALARFEQPA